MMNWNKSAKSGITLIVLIITIIVLLTLAGVSLNAIIGENGLISNSQKSNIMYSISDLQDYFGQYYVANMEDIEKLGMKNKAEALSIYPESKKWFYKPSNDGYGNLNYIVDLEGNAYFLLNKREFLKTHQGFDIRGGDAGEGTYADYNELNDVYGVNSRLEVYYITKNEDGTLNIMGTQAIDKDNPNRIVFAKGSANANFVRSMLPNPDINGDGELSASEIATIDTITIDSTHSIGLNELYNFPALKTLNIKDTNLASLDGLRDLRLLEYLSLDNVSLTEGGSFEGIKSNTKLKYLYVLETNDTFVKSLWTQMKDVSYSKLEYIGIYGNGTNITNTSMDLMASFQSGTKNAVKKLYLNGNNLTNIEFLSGFNYLEYINVTSNGSLSSLKGLNSIYLDSVFATTCNLGVNESSYDTTKTNNGMDLENDALAFLQKCTSVKTLEVNDNKIKWLSYINSVTAGYSSLQLLGNSTFNSGEVASIKQKYNSSNKKNIDEIYKKYLNDKDMFDFSRNLNSTTVASLADDSDDFVALQNLSQTDKNLVKAINLQGNNSLTSGKISELFSGKKADGTSTRKGDV